MRFFLFLTVCIVLGGILLNSLACPFRGPQYPVIYGNTATPTPPMTASVTISGSTYSPASVTIGVGGTVVWLNNDPYPHSVEPSSGAACAADNAIGGSSAITLTFPTTGTVHYHCSIHAASCNGVCSVTCTGPMTGTVVVQ